MNGWSADVGNDPEQDFDLVIELMEQGEHRGRLKRDGTGNVLLEVYGGSRFVLPVEWLQEVIGRAEKEVWPCDELVDAPVESE